MTATVVHLDEETGDEIDRFSIEAVFRYDPELGGFMPYSGTDEIDIY